MPYDGERLDMAGEIAPHTLPSSPRKDPVLRGFPVQALLSLEYRVTRLRG